MKGNLLAGRGLVLIGIVLLALNLRTGIAVVSPIVRSISEDVPMSGVDIGLLGMLPPLAFATAGFFAPLHARRHGLEATMVLACAAMIVGPIVRAFADNYVVLVLGSALLLSGMGFGNILLPPIIKKYFPDRIGALTALYVTLLAVSSALPPLVVVPLTDTTSWRVALGVWSVGALVTALPWVLLWRDRRRDARAAKGERVEVATGEIVGRMVHSQVARALTLALLLTSFNVYALFAWLPEIITDLTGAPATTAGSLLALFAIMGLPSAAVVPMLVPRVANVAWLFAAGMAAFTAGYLGLLLVPQAVTALWIAMLGSGMLIFPVVLALVSFRTRSHHTSVALSGFVQGISYGGASLGPFLVGLVHDLAGGWTAPLLLLMCSMLLTVWPALVLARPRTVEEDLAHRTPRSSE